MTWRVSPADRDRKRDRASWPRRISRSCKNRLPNRTAEFLLPAIQSAGVVADCVEQNLHLPAILAQVTRA